VWAGGTLASAVTGNGLHAPSLTVDNAATLVRQGPAALWPRVPAWAVLACTLLVAALVAAIVVQVVRRVRPWLRDQGSRASLAALARAGDLPRLTPRGAAAEARKLRPTLRGVKRPDPADTGLALGQVDGVTLRASWEDVVLAVMAPRSGKTTSLAVPIIVAAPGAVVATSNKADLPAAVAGVRAEHGTVWTFDPQRIAYTPQRFVWNPLAGVTTVEEAHRLAGHFVVGVESTGDKFWSAAATDLLTGSCSPPGSPGAPCGRFTPGCPTRPAANRSTGWRPPGTSTPPAGWPLEPTAPTRPETASTRRHAPPHSACGTPASWPG
jgi:hypothetical protein